MKVFILGVDSINRIRLEFKVLYAASAMASAVVLIESDWNLKLRNLIIIVPFKPY